MKPCTTSPDKTFGDVFLKKQHLPKNKWGFMSEGRLINLILIKISKCPEICSTTLEYHKS